MYGEDQLLPGPARVSCGPDSCVASSQGSAWISGRSWAELLTTCYFSCSQWLPKPINSCDPVAAAKLVILRVLADDKRGRSFAGNSLCREGLRSFCHRTVPKDLQGELALHGAIQLGRTEGQKSWLVSVMPSQLLAGAGMKVQNKLQLAWKPGHVARGALWQENLFFP